jgi:hypothetical protein
MEGNLLKEVEAAGLLALAAERETLPVLSKTLGITEHKLLNMIDCKEPMCRRVARYLGLKREIWYRYRTDA